MLPFVFDPENSLPDYRCYHPTKPVTVLHYEMPKDELDQVSLLVAASLNQADMLLCVEDYLRDLQNSGEEAARFYGGLLKAPLPDDWFDTLEVYSAEISLASETDYSAVITCGDSIFPDHILEMYWEQTRVTDVLLVG